MDGDINAVLDSYKNVINALIERVNAQDEMIKASLEKSKSIEKLIFDEVLNPAKEAMNQCIYDAGLEDFSSKYGEKLSGYGDSLKAIEGDDFDILKQAYDGYNAIEGEKPDEAMYVEELIKVIDEQLNGIREKLGVPADAEVAVKQDADGETKVEVDGAPVADAKAEEGTEEEIIEDAGEDESDPDELAALEKELMAYK